MRIEYGCIVHFPRQRPPQSPFFSARTHSSLVCSPDASSRSSDPSSSDGNGASSGDGLRICSKPNNGPSTPTDRARAWIHDRFRRGGFGASGASAGARWVTGVGSGSAVERPRTGEEAVDEALDDDLPDRQAGRWNVQ